MPVLYTFSWSFGDIKSIYLCTCGRWETKATQPSGPIPTELVKSDRGLFVWDSSNTMSFHGDALMHVGEGA